MVEKLDERKKNILMAIIHEHVLTVEPVGSRTLAKSYDFGISSATIRNEMSDLEELGYLEQPYTSAGRVPSDKGYRFYVDFLMKAENKFTLNLDKFIKDIQEEKEGIQSLMSSMATMLSRITRYTTIVSEPQLQSSKVKQLQLMQVDKKTILIVLITTTGTVHNKIIKIEQEMDSRQLNYINQFLTDKLINLNITSITPDYIKELEKELISKLGYPQNLLKLMYSSLSKITKPKDLKIYLGGTSYILEQPEFSDLEYLKKVLNVLDHEEILRELFNSLPENGIEVMIGQENELEEMQKCSIVFATYSVNNQALGKIGVIGPTRMEYSRVISTVNSAAELLGKIILKLSR